MKVIIQNSVTGKEYIGKFETEQELNAWVQKQLDKGMKNPWGKPEQELLVDPLEYPERAQFVEELVTQEPEFDENFMPVLIEDGYELDENGEQVLDLEGNPKPLLVQSFVEVTKHRVRIPQEFTVYIDEVPQDYKPIYQQKLRDEIENVLDKTDWLFISDVIISSTHRTIYQEYRQLLRTEHSRSLDYYSDEDSFTYEKFENYVRRTRPELFLEGGDGPSVVKKFMSKLD